MSTATKTRPSRSKTLAEVMRRLKERRAAWRGIRATNGVTLGDMPLHRRLAAEAASARYAAATAALAESLRRHRKPVVLDGRTVLRLSADGAGPATVHRSLFSSEKGFREFLRSLDEADARRRAEAKAKRKGAPR